MTNDQNAHRAIRTCVACGTKTGPDELVRFVRNADGSVCVDASGRKPGRGAYLCFNEACFAKAKKRRSLASALRCSISADDFEHIAYDFAQACAQRVHAD